MTHISDETFHSHLKKFLDLDCVKISPSDGALTPKIDPQGFLKRPEKPDQESLKSLVDSEDME